MPLFFAIQYIDKIFAVILISISTVSTFNICENRFDGELLTDFTSCSRYYECYNETAEARECREGFFFSQELQGCSRCYACPRDGALKAVPVPQSCTQYVLCYGGSITYRECPEGTHFNEFIQNCDLPENAGCLEEPTEKPTPPTTEGETETTTEEMTSTVLPSFYQDSSIKFNPKSLQEILIPIVNSLPVPDALSWDTDQVLLNCINGRKLLNLTPTQLCQMNIHDFDDYKKIFNGIRNLFKINMNKNSFYDPNTQYLIHKSMTGPKYQNLTRIEFFEQNRILTPHPKQNQNHFERLHEFLKHNSILSEKNAFVILPQDL
uniref:CSON000193 protein n=1 Tax=Culicoides sonorensis TaxID=179676 RepID=A0A336MJJ2_CULSO